MSMRRLLVRMLQTTRLNRVAHRLYYRHVHGFESATPALCAAVQRCLAIAAEDGLLERGDYCEFGVFKGKTLWQVQRLLTERYPDSSMRCFGFDSFEGLPEIRADVDRTTYGEFYAGQYACSYDNVRRMMDEAGTDWSRTFLTSGYFNESLTDEMAREHDLNSVAIALVDCDLYASTADVMRFLAPRLCDGAVVMMDDWGCFRGDAGRGQKRAMRECLERHPQCTIEPLFRYGDWSEVFRWRCDRPVEIPDSDDDLCTMTV